MYNMEALFERLESDEYFNNYIHRLDMKLNYYVSAGVYDIFKWLKENELYTYLYPCNARLFLDKYDIVNTISDVRTSYSPHYGERIFIPYYIAEYELNSYFNYITDFKNACPYTFTIWHFLEMLRFDFDKTEILILNILDR